MPQLQPPPSRTAVAALSWSTTFMCARSASRTSIEVMGAEPPQSKNPGYVPDDRSELTDLLKFVVK